MQKLAVFIAVSIAAIVEGDCRAAALDLQSELQVILQEEGLTGIAWSLVGVNGNVETGATGMRDNASHAEFTADTRFHVGSVTKSLLATGVLRLATQGLVDLDAPVTRYLPQVSFENPWRDRSRVTVRHLLDHTSGLNDAYLWQMFSERPNPATPLVAAFPEPAEQLRIRTRPGARLSYSNMGYTLLGLIIESVADGRYENYLDEHLLAPLEMHDSTFGFTTQEGSNADPTLAWGHVDDGSRYAAKPVFLRPAAQFTTTATDLALYAKFLMSAGVLAGQTFIDEEFMRSRGRPAGTEAADNGLLAGYALGLGRRDRHDVVGYCHGGNTVGFVAMLCIYPDEGKAFAFGVNTDSETASYGRIEGLMIRALGIAEAAPPQTAETLADISDWHGRYVPSPSRFQSFEYLDTLFGSIAISPNGEILEMDSVQRPPRRLRPTGGRTYSANDRATTSHVLLHGEEGEYLVSDGFNTFEKVSTLFMTAHWVSFGLALFGLTWLIGAGIVSLFRYRATMPARPVAPAFFSIVLLFLPLPFFLAQSFMALGDRTLAGVLLALVTALLPVGMLLTIIRANRVWKQYRWSTAHALAAAFVLQWCAVLVSHGLLPLRLWA